MQKISPYLWFNDQAEEAAMFYISLFKNSRIVGTMPGPEGRVMGVAFELEGQEFIALNGGPQFTFTEAISFFVHCETQDEVDHFWNALIADGGEESRCGWLKDKYGLSWQIIPNALGELMGDPDRERANRAMNAMLQMNKIVIADLQKAYDGE
ncbi:MAG: VOC family protein [Chloroflexi bacterium]|nr:VOC family protein [Chloroflexota bacterium]